MAPQGREAVRAGALRCACGRWLGPRQALRVAFVALQVVVLIPSIVVAVTVIGVHGMGFAAGLGMQVHLVVSRFGNTKSPELIRKRPYYTLLPRHDLACSMSQNLLAYYLRDKNAQINNLTSWNQLRHAMIHEFANIVLRVK